MPDPDTEETPEASPPPIPPWGELGLTAELLSAIGERGYEFPTPVQAEAIPAALQGRDLLVRSKTGTGKTAAFMIPVLDRVPAGYRKAASITLCPTRELAIQIAEETRSLCKDKELEIVAVYGGVPIGPQADALNGGAEIVIGTPGRVRDHIRRGNLVLKDALFGVLDEADEMLSMGFFEEVSSILDELPDQAQTLLFSATIEEKLKQLIGKYLKDPHEIYLSVDTDRSVEAIDHIIYETTLEYPKPRQLLHVLEVEHPDSAIIFCNTRSDTDVVARFLNRQGLVAEALSSDLNQRARERVMARIKRGEIDFLVATDIAARGIDISDLSHVINYALPEDPAVYLHRTGRTGRAGKTGIAISFMGGREISCRKILERKYEIDFEERTLPTREEAENLWSKRHMAEMRKAVDEGLAFEGFLGMARNIRERGEEADALIAIALRGFFRWHRMRTAQPNDTADSQGDEPRRESGGPRSGGGRGRGGRRDGSQGGRRGGSSGRSNSGRGGRGGRRSGGGQR